MMAVKNRHFECVRALLNAGANPNGDERSLCSPLYIASMDGFTDAIVASITLLLRNWLKFL
jgi:ankyrin repeat protein